MTDTGHLDAEELLHLALQAMDEHRDADAIGFLKRGSAISPGDGRMKYLLGALHAQLGMYERATAELEEAVALAPEIDMAHFQLGLLRLTSGNSDGAVQAWEPLDRLGDEEPLRLFVAGMLQLIEENYDGCIALLQQGIANGHEQKALNRDMQRVIETAIEARAKAPQADEPQQNGTTPHVLLSGYRMPAAGESPT